MAEQIDASRVDAIMTFDILDDGGKVGHVVNFRSVEIAAGATGVPEAIAFPIAAAIGRGVNKTCLFGRRGQTKVVDMGFSVRSISVKNDKKRGRSPVIIGGRKVDRIRAVGQKLLGS
jgi:hypothetical protein